MNHTNITGIVKDTRDQINAFAKRKRLTIIEEYLSPFSISTTKKCAEKESEEHESEKDKKKFVIKGTSTSSLSQ